MRTRFAILANAFILITLFIYSSATLAAKTRGIYITQTTLEDTKRLTHIINRAKAVGINTFVIDYERPSKLTTQNIQLVKDNGFKYVARIVIFPDGAKNKAQMFSESHREKKFGLIKDTLGLGAETIQIDYIRYSSKNKPSDQNAQDVKNTIAWYRDKLKAYNPKIPLQIDVFGITSFHPEKRIGQYPKVFAGTVDGINPMVYPSHYEPFRLYSSQPYKTVHSSLLSLKEQLKDQPPVKITAFIEASNYRYPLPGGKKAHYVSEQIRAVEDANIDGWYFWSANNLYEHVFNVLQSKQSTPKTTKAENIKATSS